MLKRLLDADVASGAGVGPGNSRANRQNSRQETALHAAARGGHLECVALLLEMGAQSRASDAGETPAMCAVRARYSLVVRHLAGHGHLDDTPRASVEAMLSIATAGGDVATESVLHRFLDPELDDVAAERERERAALPLEKATAEAARTAEAAAAVRRMAEPRPLEPLLPLGASKAWAPSDVERWAEETLSSSEKSENSENSDNIEEESALSEVQILGALRRYHVSGAVLHALTALEVGALLQRVGLPPPMRGRFAEEFLRVRAREEGPAPKFGFTEMRLLPLALGDAVTFRVVGFVRAAMSTPLQTLRRFVSTTPDLDAPLPSDFVFCSMRNEVVPRTAEASVICAHLGFVVIASQAPASQAPASQVPASQALVS